MILKRNIRSFYYLNILLWKAADLNKRQTNSHGIEKKSSFIVAQPYFCTMDWPTVYWVSRFEVSQEIREGNNNKQ